VSAHDPADHTVDLDARRRGVRLSILMPAYNEDRTIRAAVQAVLRQEYPCPVELVVVDDGSEIPVARFLDRIGDPRLTLYRHEVNLGKGAALRQAAALATGTHMVPFDADLEYDPADLVAMLAPVLAGRCEIVYGARLSGANTRYQSYRHGLANKLLTLAANLTFDAYISDLHTCLKLMPLDMFRSFSLKESGFGLDTEITARILRTGNRPFEVPASYHSRSKEQGKKIAWRDGVECIGILVRVRRASLRTAVSGQTAARRDLQGPVPERTAERDLDEPAMSERPRRYLRRVGQESASGSQSERAGVR